MPITHVTFSVRLYMSEPLDDGKYPLVLQISWRDQKANVRRKRLGLSCSPDEFDTRYDRVKHSVWGASKRNEQIDEAFDRAVQIYKQNFSDKPWDYKTWAELFDQKEDDVVTFDSFTKKHVAKLFSMNKGGTGIYYNDALKALQKFTGKEKIRFEEVTKGLLKDFEADIISRGHKGDRTMRGLKGLFSKAVEDEVIDMKTMPFKTGYNPIGYKFNHLHKIKKPSSLIKRLSSTQVKAILDYQPKNESEERAMDLWKFSYFTMGVNLKDIALMKTSDIRDGLWL